jgi:hypothetical protein
MGWEWPDRWMEDHGCSGKGTYLVVLMVGRNGIVPESSTGRNPDGIGDGVLSNDREGVVVSCLGGGKGLGREG